VTTKGYSKNLRQADLLSPGIEMIDKKTHFFVCMATRANKLMIFMIFFATFVRFDLKNDDEDHVLDFW